MMENLDRQMLEVMSAVGDATEIDDDQPIISDEGKVIGREPPPKPEGWTKKRFRMARDLRKSTQDAPVYAKIAAGQVQDMRRRDAEKSVNINVRHEFVLPEKVEYRDVLDVVVVSDDEPKGRPE